VGRIVIGRQYFARQAMTLLKFASSTTNAKLAAALIEKAADLKSKVDEASPPPDRSPRPPDVDSPLESGEKGGGYSRLDRGIQKRSESGTDAVHLTRRG
jgi:hypothetical protein